MEEKLTAVKSGKDWGEDLVKKYFYWMLKCGFFLSVLSFNLKKNVIEADEMIFKLQCMIQRPGKAFFHLWCSETTRR